MVQITGNTYNNRALIKANGGKWDAASKCWTMDDNSWGWIKGHADGCRVVGESIAKTATPKIYRPAVVAGVNAPCRSCGSYCFGDCSSND